MGSKRKTLDLATRHCVGIQSCIVELINNFEKKEELMEAMEKGGQNMKMEKKLRCADHKDVDKALLAWFNQSRGQNVNIVPCRYDYNKKAWITNDLFIKWLKAFGAHVSTSNRKVVLFIDNCPVHPTVELRNRELVFLPSNTTSELQPMDQGIIQLVNKKFRDILRFAPVGMQSSRNTSSTVFRHAQCVVGKAKQITEKVDNNPDDTECLPAKDDKVAAEFGDEAASLQPGTIAPGVAYEDYLAVDDNTPAWGTLDDEDLISGHNESTDKEWEGKEDTVPKPTREGMLENYNKWHAA
ncbi:hypothetical protein PR048_005193 [Dryococelus australis]|uniref:DDE-1 domain-containing protein n=1 Tax=Dryococelus australis TaxID=614101 RepID=A0ABQ9I804_9NEOP|nr:hypothetical protein PR048_005193 [Dryococelus australis]